MGDILTKLSGGDLRSIGRADEVVDEIIGKPILFHSVFEGIQHEDPLIRMRAADVIEKVSRSHPEYLAPHKDILINEFSKIDQQEVRWHVALLFSYLDLTDTERKNVMEILAYWMRCSKSRIVKVNALQSLVSIGKTDDTYRGEIAAVLKKALESGSPAVVSRAKKLLKQVNE